MDSATIKELVQLRGKPAVSILCPLDVRRPGNEHDPAALRELRDRAVAEVNATLAADAAATLITRIDEAIDGVDLGHPTPGVALLVSSAEARVVALDTTVEPSVAVGDGFAIRALIPALQSARARILLLSQERSRCLDLTGSHIAERHDSGFPVEIVPPTEADTPHRDYPLDEHERAEAAKFVLRAVDHAVAALERRDPRPLVLVGVERDLAYFDEVAGARQPVIGRVHGNHLRDTADEVARLVRPVLDEHRRATQRDACTEVREAIGAHAVSGIVDTWTAARAGRGHRLVVEAGYVFPARVSGETLEGVTDEGGSLDAVADTVAEVIRHDGEVVVVPAGALADLEHIALLTRY